MHYILLLLGNIKIQLNDMFPLYFTYLFSDISNPFTLLDSSHLLVVNAVITHVSLLIGPPFDLALLFNLMEIDKLTKFPLN